MRNPGPHLSCESARPRVNTVGAIIWRTFIKTLTRNNFLHPTTTNRFVNPGALRGARRRADKGRRNEF